MLAGHVPKYSFNSTVVKTRGYHIYDLHLTEIQWVTCQLWCQRKRAGSPLQNLYILAVHSPQLSEKNKSIIIDKGGRISYSKTVQCQGHDLQFTILQYYVSCLMNCTVCDIKSTPWATAVTPGIMILLDNNHIATNFSLYSVKFRSQCVHIFPAEDKECVHVENFVMEDKDIP